MTILTRTLSLLAALVFLAPVAPEKGLLFHWRLGSTHLVDDDAFRSLVGEQKLWLGSDPTFVGAGDAESLVLLPEDFFLTAGEAFDAAGLPRKQITLEAWVAVDVVKPWGGFVCALEDDGDHERGFMLGLKNDRFCFGLTTEKKGRVTYLRGDTAYRPGRWYHVAGCYDGKVQRLYVNGKKVAESTEQGGPILYDETHEFVVGAYKDRNEDHRLTGAIHEVRVYNRALGGRALKKHYDAGRDLLPLPLGKTFSGVAPPETESLAELQPRINAAIDRGVEHLLREQHRDGCWAINLDGYRNGGTSLALYTIVKSGIRPSHPAVQAALRFLRQKDPTRTYSTGCQLLALAAIGQKQHREWAERLVDILLMTEHGEHRGGWAYPDHGADLSNTQFAAMGLWGGSKLGVEAPSEYWQRLATYVIEKHQPFLREVQSDTLSAGRTGKIRIGGYTYRPAGNDRVETGSMTTAGLCVLALAERCAGRRLGGRVRRQIESSKASALGWLEHNYTVARNPGKDDRHFYYLYGLERVGALLEMDEIGGHPWYRDGAQVLLDKQGGDGSWDYPAQTCFALLFLSKATAPTTGREVSGRQDTWSTSGGDVSLYATGPTEFSVWITGFDDWVMEELNDRLKVRRVHYLADDEEIAVVPGNVARPWAGDRYPTRHRFEDPGPHTLQAMVELLPAAEGEEPMELWSPLLTVESRLSPEQWMLANLATVGDNQLARTRVRARASTTMNDQKMAEKAVDGLEATCWLSDARDEQPWIRLDLEAPVKSSQVVLSPVDSKITARGEHDFVARVEVRINGDDEILEIEMNADPLARTFIPLAKKRRVRTVEIRILERTTGRADPGSAGFAEIALY